LDVVYNSTPVHVIPTSEHHCIKVASASFVGDTLSIGIEAAEFVVVDNLSGTTALLLLLIHFG